MNQDLLNDQLTTFSVLSYLSAFLQGEFAYLNVAPKLSLAINEGSVESVQKEVAKVLTWIEGAYYGECLFSANGLPVETFDSKAATKAIERAQANIENTVNYLLTIASKDSLPKEDELASIVALYIKLTYSRDAYLRHHLQFAFFHRKGELVDSYNSAIEGSSDELKQAHSILHTYQETLQTNTFNGPLLTSLYDLCRTLVVLFNLQLHDVRQLTAPWKGGINFKTLGFSHEESLNWEGENFSPIAAGYWKAYEFKPEDAREWCQTGVSDPSLAAIWRSHRFTPEKARSWLHYNLSPVQAAIWNERGYGPREASERILRGELIPQAQRKAA